jgi:hypothetical protein
VPHSPTVGRIRIDIINAYLGGRYLREWDTCFCGVLIGRSSVSDQGKMSFFAELKKNIMALNTWLFFVKHL